MRTNAASGHTITSQARRTQIVTAAVQVIAEDGLARASFARIAARAGLSSPGMISYHFADKDELFTVLCEDTLAGCVGEIEQAVAAAEVPSEALVSYLRAFIAWQDAHRAEVAALWRLSSGWAPPGATAAFDESILAAPLHAILTEGAARGDLRKVNVPWVIETILCAVEGFHQALKADPDLAASEFADQLVDLFSHGLAAHHG